MRRLVLVGLCACGRIAFDPSAGALSGDANDAGDGAMGSAVCGLGGGLRDDFEDGVVDNHLWGDSYTNPGTSMAETGGSLILTPAISMSTTYVGIKTSRFFDMRGQRYVAEVSQVAASGTNSGLQIDTSGAYASFTHINGNLRAAYNTTGFVTVASTPYDSTLRFWSMREEAGELIYETSGDGITFAELGRTTAPFDFSLVKMNAFSGTANPVSAPGEMHIDAIGVPGAMLAQCPSTDLVDTFDGFDPRKWLNSQTDACCSYVAGGGDLLFTTDGTAGTVVVRSSHGYDLRGSAVTVELSQNPSAANVIAGLILRYDDKQYAELTVSATMTNARFVNGPSIDPMLATRDPLERWLRIREDQGTLYFEVSKDKATWRQLRSGAPPFSVADLLLGMNLNTVGSSAADSVRFDNFNAP